MFAAALETFADGSAGNREQRRRKPRRRLSLNVASRIGDAGMQEVLIHDLSVSGLLLESHTALASGEAITVELPEAPEALAHVVWSSGHFYGCQFDRPIPGAAVSAALLRSPFDAASSELPPPAGSDEKELPYDVERGRLGTSPRILAVVGLSVLLWALLLWGVGIV